MKNHLTFLVAGKHLPWGVVSCELNVCKLFCGRHLHYLAKDPYPVSERLPWHYAHGLCFPFIFKAPNLTNGYWSRWSCPCGMTQGSQYLHPQDEFGRREVKDMNVAGTSWTFPTYFIRCSLCWCYPAFKWTNSCCISLSLFNKISQVFLIGLKISD